MWFKSGIGLLSLSLALVLVGSLTVTGLLNTSKTLTSTGQVNSINVEVYWDRECTQVARHVEWGNIEPGESIEKTIFIKNNGDAPMTLHMYSSSWDPAVAEICITLTWDKQGATIFADEVLEAMLILIVSDLNTVVTDFSFNIVIEGTS